MTLLLQKDAEAIPGYRLEQRLGKGGFGEVWRALKSDGFPVALKFILLETFPNPHEVRALEVLKQIRHPNLLSTLGFRQTDEYVIQEMELADGTLQDRFNEATASGLGGIPRDELLEYMLESAKGIDYLNAGTHRIAGKENVALQHCDIKPQNLLLVGGSVKVGDFGLVRLMENTMVTHTEGLSPMYAAPEFFASKASRFSDQYSLGITYVYLRSGQFPFAGNPRQLMYGHCMAAPDLSMLPEDEARVVHRCLAKTPEDRWPNCLAFVRALLATQGHVVIAVDPSRAVQYPTMIPQSSETPPSIAGQEPARPSSGAPIPSGSDTNRIRGPLLEELQHAASPSGVDTPRKATDTHKRVVTGKEPTSSAPTTEGTRVLATPSPIQPLPTQATAAPAPSPAKATAASAPPTPPPSAPSAASPTLPCSTTLTGHGGAIWGVTFLLGDDRILSSSSDGSLRLWDLVDAKEVRRLEVRPNPVVCTAFRVDGKRALVASMDRVIRLWDLEAGRELRSLCGHTSSLTTLAFAFEGIWGLSGSWDQTIRVWDLDTGNEIRCLSGHGKAVTSLVLSPDGQHVLSSSADSTVRLWNVRSGQEVLRCQGHAGLVSSVAFATDGKTFVSGGADGSVRLWDARSGKELRSFGSASGAIGCVAVAGDDRFVLGAAMDRAIRVWDANSGQEVVRCLGHTDLVACLTVSSDGRSVASGGKDKSIRIWDLPEK